MKKLMKLVLPAAVLTGALLVTACGKGKVPAAASPEGGKSVVLAMSSTWDTLCPFFTTSNYGDIIFTQIYDKLVYQKGDYTITPRLAVSWESSPDKTAITLKLNPKARWHDGKPLTAEDVVATARFAADGEIKAKKRSNYLKNTDNGGILIPGETLGVEAPDAHTVVFHFKNPLDPDIFLYNYCRSFYVLPKHILEGKTAEELNNGDFWVQNIVGSGPFKYADQIAGERVTLRRNEDYHLGAPKFETLIIRVVPTTGMLAGLQTGEIDIISGGGTGNIPLEDWDAAKADKRLVTISHPTLGYQAMNVSVAKPYLTKRIREAVNIAVNRQAMVDGLLNGEGEALDAFISAKNHPYYQNKYVREYNPEKARQILKEEKWDPNRTLNLLVPIGNTVRERSALLIQQDLAAVGIKVNITSADFSTVMAQAQRADGPDLNLIGSASSLDPDEGGSWFNPAGNTNFSAFPPDQTEIFDLFLEARRGTSFGERKPLYDNIQRVILDSGSRLFLYVTNALVAHSTRIGNADIESFANVNWDTWNWTVE